MSFRFIPLFLLLSLLSSLSAQQLPDGFFDTPVIENLDFPLGMTFDEDGRMYVWEKKGIVWIYDSDGQRLPEPLIDLRERIADYAEHGLNYFLLDKDYFNNGRIFVYHVLDLHWHYNFGTADYDPNATITTEATIGRLSSFIVNDPAGDAPSADISSENILLGQSLSDGIPILMTSHGIGSVLQAEDGTLLLSNGDGSSFLGTDVGSDSLETRVSSALEHGIIEPHQDIGSYKSQYRNVLNGKILRIDAETGDGVPSNPFYIPESPRHPASRIWAYGFRNPYRVALKPLSGSHNEEDGDPGVLVVGDVGGAYWEEINLVSEGGMNFGWPVYEGNRNNWGFNNYPDIPNPFAPNPLFGTNGCTQQYFGFKQLVRNRNPQSNNYYFNPCDSEDIIGPEDGFVFASAPTLLWNNRNYNPGDIAALPIWNADGFMDRISITDPRSTVEGDNFTGEASLGGVFYTSDSYPQAYQNAYFHMDYSGWIKAFYFDENNSLYRVAPFVDDLRRPNHLALNPVNGNLYYTTLEYNQIRMISFGGNPPPVAIATQVQFFGGRELTVYFDASSSYDPNETELTYHWDFGDGSEATGIAPQHNFATSLDIPVSFNVVLTVTDAEGASDQTSMLVSLNNSPPNVNITSFSDGDLYPTYQTSLLDLAAAVSDTESPVEDLQIEWRVFLHHDTHFHPEASLEGQFSHILLTPAGCSDEGTYWYRIRLTATDPQGLTTTVEQEIFPDCAPEPVNWVELSGNAVDAGVQLNIATFLTGEVAKLEVQRSPDFFSFQTIGELEPNDDQTYTSFDSNPIIGVGYYRIKARMSNGAIHFSDPEPVSFNSGNGYHISPNPSNGYVNMSLYNPSSNIARVSLYSLSGQQLFLSRFPLTPGQITHHRLDISILPKGMYLYRIEDGEQVYQGKLLVL